jgi:hypothetical protein
MGFFESVTLEGVRDGVQVLLCLVILACLARNRTTSARRPQPRPEAHAAFVDEVGLHGLRQQAEQSLAAIRQAVEAECRRLERWRAAGDSGFTPAAAEAEPVDLGPFRLGESTTGRYDALPRMATDGLTTRELASRCLMPAGEVELALKLRRLNARGLQAQAKAVG